MSQIAIEMLLPEGEPNGIRVIKVAGWIGRAFVVPRSHIKQIKNLKEATYPAVYFLFGKGEELEEEQETVYIGQTDNFLRRLTQQLDEKNYWNSALVFTGESEIDAQYLERMCVERARTANRYTIKNIAGTPGRSISEFQRAAQHDFFARMELVTAILGYPLFENPEEALRTEIYTFTIDHASAQGRLLENQNFIVYKDSTARIREVDSLSKGSKALRAQLVAEGILAKMDDHSYRFTQDYIFNTPSAAADAIGAHSRNGWIVWRDNKKKTLDENVRK